MQWERERNYGYFMALCIVFPFQIEKLFMKNDKNEILMVEFKIITVNWTQCCTMYSICMIFCLKQIDRKEAQKEIVGLCLLLALWPTISAFNHT